MNKIESLKLKNESFINHALPDWLTGRNRPTQAEKDAAEHAATMEKYSQQNRDNMDQQYKDKVIRLDEARANQSQQRHDSVEYKQALQRWEAGPDDVPFMVNGAINKDLLR